MAARVACEKCGNMVASTSKLCPYCRSDPNRWRRRGTYVLVVVAVIFFADQQFNQGALIKAALVWIN